MSDLQQLNETLGMKGVAEVVLDRGLPAVRVVGGLASQGAAGTVHLHGGHVAAWRPAGVDEVLWLSEKSAWEQGKPIRGGVPICFPWFGPRKDAGPAPSGAAGGNAPGSPPHGFARLREWSLETIQKSPAGVVVTLRLASNHETRQSWPHDFVLRQHVTFGPQLIMALELTNSGADSFTAELAQHTYLSVGDVRQAIVAGLAGTRYIDKVDAAQEKPQRGDITITGETDRVYLDTTAPVTLRDPVLRRQITIAKENSRATVVWNPWIAKARAMADFGDEEWPGMICVETCNVAAYALTLQRGQTRTMTTRISVSAL